MPAPQTKAGAGSVCARGAGGLFPEGGMSVSGDGEGLSCPGGGSSCHPWGFFTLRGEGGLDCPCCWKGREPGVWRFCGCEEASGPVGGADLGEAACVGWPVLGSVSGLLWAVPGKSHKLGKECEELKGDHLGFFSAGSLKVGELPSEESL